TGFPECLDGRVKTLHPAIHAGLLADTGRPRHADQLADLGIAAFDLLVSNLYPFEATVASGAPAEECVAQIDICGPAMVRAAAKTRGGRARRPTRSRSRWAGAAARGARVSGGQRRTPLPSPSRPPPPPHPAPPTCSPPTTPPDTPAQEAGGRAAVPAGSPRR